MKVVFKQSFVFRVFAAQVLDFLILLLDAGI